MLLFWKRECIKVKIDFEHSLFLFPPIFLSFHSYQRGYSNAERINKLFASELKKNGLQCEIKSYYLNCEKYGSTDEERRISGFIDDSSIWGADLIAVLDDQATYSLMACNHPKIRKIPVVFSGVNYPNMELLQHPTIR